MDCFVLSRDYTSLLQNHEQMEEEIQSIQRLVREAVLSDEEGTRATELVKARFQNFKAGVFDNPVLS